MTSLQTYSKGTLSIEIPTVSITDLVSLSDKFAESNEAYAAEYAKDVESLPIATLPDVFLNVSPRVVSVKYPRLGADVNSDGNSGYGDSYATQKVVFPSSMVMPVQNPIVNNVRVPFLVEKQRKALVARPARITTGSFEVRPDFRSLSLTAYSDDVVFMGQPMLEGTSVNFSSLDDEFYPDPYFIEGSDFFVTVVYQIN